MAFLQFEKKQHVYVLDSSSSSNFPYIALTKFPRNSELEYVVLLLYIQGQGSGQIRLNIYSNISQTTPIYSTSWIDIDDLQSSATNKIIWTRFDFNRLPVTTGHQYVLQLETQGYTRNGDTFYLSYCKQQTDEPNANTSSYVYHPLVKPASFKLYTRS